MKKHFWKNPEGSIAVMVALMLTGLIGFVGLAVDIGNLYVVRTRMQNAVDAAVCAGGLQLTDQGKATIQANLLITNNNFTPASGQPTFDPANTKKISYSLTKNVSTNFMGLFGYGNVPITVSATAILQSGGTNPGGPFDYTIFSGSETLDLTVNGSQIVKGSIHSNDHLIINGSSNVSGAAEGAKGVTINGSNTIGSVMADTLQDMTINGSNTIGSKSGGAIDIAMPDYSQQIANTAAQTYNTNQTFNGTVNVDGNIYVNGTATLNGSVSSTGAIMATGNITINGSSSISGANQVCLYSSNGNITVNGSSFAGDTSSEIIYAPNGLVTINGSFTFHGRIIAKKVTINGSGNFNGADYPVTSLPGVTGKPHVKLIQ